MTERIDDEFRIYLDGRPVPTHEATVSVFDHAFLYGDGTFETYRVAGDLVFRMEDQIARMDRSAAAIALILPLARREMIEAILEMIASNHLPDYFVKVIILRAAGPEPLLEHSELTSRLVIIVRPSMPFFRDGITTMGLLAAIVGTHKTPAASLDPRVKSLNYLNVIKSRIEARGLGADESIPLDDRGRVVEAPTYNIIAVRGRDLLTPTEECLQGITLEATLEAATDRELRVHRTNLYPYDLDSVDEVLFTSTAVGLLPVATLNGRAIGRGAPGPVFHELSAAYERALRDPAQGTPVPGLNLVHAGS